MNEQMAADGRSVIAPHVGKMAGLLAIERQSNKGAGERLNKLVKQASFKVNLTFYIKPSL